MIRSTLTRRPEREDLLGFWVGMSLVCAIFLGLAPVLLGLAGVRTGAGIGAAAFGILLAVGHRRERAVDRAYGGWDRAARGYTRRARGAVVAIWYWTVIVPVARTGVRGLALEESPWSPRGTLPPEGYDDQGDGSGPAASGRTPSGMVGWAMGSGRGWTVVLVPFLAILRALEFEGRRTVASDIYTLY